MMRALRDALDRASVFLACALVVALLLCVTAGVVTRELGDPLAWTDEGARFLMVWLAVFGWVLATRGGLQVRIRYFQDKLPARLHRATEVAFQLAMVLFGALVAWDGFLLVQRNHDLEATSLPLSMAWMYAPMVLAGVVTALQGVSELRFALRGEKPVFLVAAPPLPDALAALDEAHGEGSR